MLTAMEGHKRWLKDTRSNLGTQGGLRATGGYRKILGVLGDVKATGWGGHWGTFGTLGNTEGTLGDTRGHVSPSHPPGLTLVLHGLFGVGHGPFHEADRLVHVVLDAVNHGSLRGTGGTRGQRGTERVAGATTVWGASVSLPV